jgi:hypothetical protein
MGPRFLPLLLALRGGFVNRSDLIDAFAVALATTDVYDPQNLGAIWKRAVNIVNARCPVVGHVWFATKYFNEEVVAHTCLLCGFCEPVKP